MSVPLTNCGRTNERSYMLDPVLTNSMDLIYCCSVSDTGLSDHDLIEVSLQLRNSQRLSQGNEGTVYRTEPSLRDSELSCIGGRDCKCCCKEKCVRL